MEELDITLVATQRSGVSVLLKAEGFDPSDFEWQETTVDEMREDYRGTPLGIAFRCTVSKLVHVRKSEYYFQFEKYRSKYSPAHQLRTIIEPWSRLIDRNDHLRNWLFHLRSELSAESQIEMPDDGQTDLPADKSFEQSAALVEGPLERLPAAGEPTSPLDDRAAPPIAAAESLTAGLKTPVLAYFASSEASVADGAIGTIFEGLSASAIARFHAESVQDAHDDAFAEFAPACDDILSAELPPGKACSHLGVLAAVRRLSQRLAELSEKYFGKFVTCLDERVDKESDPASAAVWRRAVIQEWTKELWRDIDDAWATWLNHIREMTEGTVFGTRPIKDRQLRVLVGHRKRMESTLWSIAARHSIPRETVREILSQYGVTRQPRIVIGAGTEAAPAGTDSTAADQAARRDTSQGIEGAMSNNLFSDPEIDREIKAKILRLQAASLEWDDNPDGRSFEDHRIDDLVKDLDEHAGAYLCKVDHKDRVAGYVEYVRKIGSGLIRHEKERGFLTDLYSEDRLREMAESSGPFMNRILFLSPEERESEIKDEVERLRSKLMPKAAKWQEVRNRRLMRIEGLFEACYRRREAEATEQVQRRADPLIQNYEFCESMKEAHKNRKIITEDSFRRLVVETLGVPENEVTAAQWLDARLRFMKEYGAVEFVPSDARADDAVPMRPLRNTVPLVGTQPAGQVLDADQPQEPGRIVPPVEARLTALDEPFAALAERVEKAIRQTAHPAKADRKPAVGAPRSWDEIEIRFLSDERVQITAGAQLKTLNYAEFGFEDGRTEKANQAWTMLRWLAEHGGMVKQASDSRGWATVEKRIQEIRRLLRGHFGLSDDPLPFIKGTGYQAQFKISSARSSDS